MFTFTHLHYMFMHALMHTHTHTHTHAHTHTHKVLPQLERFEKIYLWLGSDAQSRQAAAQFAKKLGEKRCHIVG